MRGTGAKPTDAREGLEMASTAVLAARPRCGAAADAGEDYVIPSEFDRRVVGAVADAVRDAARRSGASPSGTGERPA
jgi:hypothetical protein